MKELFEEVIKEASNKKIIIDNEEWPIAFNTIINKQGKLERCFVKDDTLPTLIINNEEEFLKYLEIYLQEEKKLNRKSVPFLHDNEHNREKLLISYLFTNACPFDFENPIPYLKRRIQMIKNKIIDNTIDIDLGNIFNSQENSKVSLKIENITQDVRMETPYKLEISLINKNELKYHLPSISYGITEENGKTYCEIYSIIDDKKELSGSEEEQFTKKMKRLLYKINSDVKDEDVKDISVSAVLSLTVLISLLNKKNISNIRGILYLPLRYLSRDIKASDTSDAQKRTYLEERNDRIQTNITDKFVRTIRRVMSQFNGIEIVNDIMIDAGYIEIVLKKNKYQTINPLLNDVSNNIISR